MTRPPRCPDRLCSVLSARACLRCIESGGRVRDPWVAARVGWEERK